MGGLISITAVMYEGFLALGIAAGGQLTTTDDVENFPGFKDIKGGTLMVSRLFLPLHPIPETNRLTILGSNAGPI